MNSSVYFTTKRGLTFIETLIVLVILLSLSGFIFRLISVTSVDFLTLKKEAQRLKGLFDSVRERAALGERGEDWAVIISTATSATGAAFSSYTIASGNLTVGLNSFSVQEAGRFNQAVFIPLAAPVTVVFRKISGEATTTTTTIPLELTVTSTKINKAFKVTVPRFGGVSYAQSP